MFLTGWGTLASCPHQEETRDKRVPVVAAVSGPLTGKLASEYPEWSGCQSQRRTPIRVAICCRKGDPFQGSLSNLRNELSEKTLVLTMQDFLLGKGTQVKNSRVREPRRTALPRGSQSSFMVMGLVSRWSLATLIQSLFGGTRIAQPRWMLARGILGSGQTRGVSF